MMSKIKDLNLGSINKIGELKVPDDILAGVKIEVYSCDNI